MKRVPEPELMEDEEQARAYSEADFSGPHSMFVRLCGEAWAESEPRGRVLDLGCGPADITVRLAERFPRLTIDGVDGSAAMLKFGAERVRRHGLEGRVRLIQGRLPACPLPGDYDAVVSNSLLHHLSEPGVLWEAVRRCARPGALVCIMDLMRPEDETQARALTEFHAADAPAVLRRDFFHSLLAAYRPEEVRAQLAAAGLEECAVRAISDRHLVVCGRMPSPLRDHCR